MKYLILVILLLAQPIYSGQTDSSSGVVVSDASSLKGNKILLVTSPNTAPTELADLLTEMYNARVTVTDIDNYAPQIDEHSYDGFVYFGAEYEELPNEGFLRDMERTHKPLLWIHYHAWELDNEFLATKGLKIADLHSMAFESIKQGESDFPLTSTDTSKIETTDENVLYWLHGQNVDPYPGAVHADNLTFITYLPDFDPLAPDFLPFLNAVKSAFGTGIPPESTLTSLGGNRILLIAPSSYDPAPLENILKEYYEADVTLISMEDYTSWIDEYAHDGFIYLGAAYEEVALPGFLTDMERTRKPVLWINYHAWQLAETFLQKRGARVIDSHETGYTELRHEDKIIPLSPTDTTRIESDADSVLYWLEGNDLQPIPGAVQLGNFTFVSYMPAFDPFDDDFAPFLKAMISAFGHLKPPQSPQARSYLQRIDEARRDGFRTGIHLPVYTASTTDEATDYASDMWHANLIRIKESGAEWVNLVATFYQKTILSSEIAPDPDLTPTLQALTNIIHDAHKVGLLVRLYATINVKELKGNQWRGVIKPSNRDLWWQHYHALLKRMAKFAYANEVESMMIGTELNSMQAETPRWLSIIDTIRNDVGYPGVIGYEANYNAIDVEWADKLDFLGVSAYWPVSETRDPDLETLDRSWQRIDRKLEQWRKRYPDVKMEFTEVGYVSQPYASVLPFSWKAFRGKGRSLTEQYNCYRALHDYLKRTPEVTGVHIFASSQEDMNPRSRGYTPFGKPAETVMTDIFNIR